MSPTTGRLSTQAYGVANQAPDLTDTLWCGEPLKPATIRDAQRLVAGHIADPEVVSEVLEILGIKERTS